MLGTASPTRGYLLVEEPGPWGLGGVPSSRLGDAVTGALLATAGQRSAKLLLVRRPGRQGPARSERRLFQVACARGEERVLTRTCAAGDVAAAAADDTGWARHDGPLLLVCTHGRKDWDCAHRGRPLASAVAAHEPDGTWECSHLGGCRFAANLLSLPTGHTYGRVDADDAAGVVAAVRAGRVLPRLLRGRSTDPMVVQAAEVHARLALGVDDAADLVPAGARRLDGTGEHWLITLAARDGAQVRVELRRGHVGHAQKLTCGAAQEQYARTWELLALSASPL